MTESFRTDAASADKKETYNGKIFRNYFMKLIFQTRRCAYFKVRELDNIKFQDKTNRKTPKYQNINNSFIVFKTIPYEFI